MAQTRLLTRILVALTYREGAVRRAEIGALDAETFAMVITLMDAFGSGRPARAAWEQAVAAARQPLRRGRRRPPVMSSEESCDPPGHRLKEMSAQLWACLLQAAPAAVAPGGG